MKLKITHLTSVHPRYDTRIFVKECQSLAAYGYDVSLIVADGKGDESGNVSIYDVGKPSGRFKRILQTTTLVYQKAVKLDSDLYHLHDPELIPVGIKLKKLGKKVIFDAHEDVPVQILSKPYLGTVAKQIFSALFSLYEKTTCSKFDAVITATPFIRDKFSAINPLSVDINNFPLLTEFESNVRWKNRSDTVCYIGGISTVRGISELVLAMDKVQSNIQLILAGSFGEKGLYAQVCSLSGWKKVVNKGFVDRHHIKEILSSSKAGLVTLHPIRNYIDALPVKMFEYMAAGVPVIASDFPLWREIIEKNACGLCVDPLQPSSIADAIDWIITHPAEAEKMGQNGQIAVKSIYNWKHEEDKLLQLYSKIFSGAKES